MTYRLAIPLHLIKKGKKATIIIIIIFSQYLQVEIKAVDPLVINLVSPIK